MLHRVVREHKSTLFAEAEARSASGRGYPRHVRDEFDKYERCGILAYGVVRARCQTCGDEEVVGFSCKRKTLCCSCAGTRMAEVTTHLVENVLPVARYRQWTLSVPWGVRVLLMVHPELVGRLQRMLVRIISTYTRRKARDLMAVRGTPMRRGIRLLTGAVVAIQRFGSRINVHTHVHAVVPDAVWVRGADGTLIAMPDDVPDGMIDIVVVASDDLGIATTSTPVTVTKGAPCTSASQCAPEQKCDAGRCYWDPPTGELGDACSYAQACKSWQCADTADGKRCVTDCRPDEPSSCPDGFACSDLGDNKAMCLSLDGGGCCSASSSAGGTVVFAILSLVVMIAMMRPRRA